MGWYEDMRKEAYNKLSGMTQTAIELGWNQNWRGDTIFDWQAGVPENVKQFFQYAERFLPISVKGMTERQLRGTKIGKTERLLGISPAGTTWRDPEGKVRSETRYRKLLKHRQKRREHREERTYGEPPGSDAIRSLYGGTQD